MVSIHAPAGGATKIKSKSEVKYAGFNPRARRGRDFDGSVDVMISSSFNPRARRGRDGL